MARESVPPLEWVVVSSGVDGPGPRSRHGLVFDQATGAAILFGGIVWRGGGRLEADTWELRDRIWSRVATPNAPPPRHRGAMVYLAHRGFSVLFGGQGSRNEFLGDTWIYTGRRWRRARMWNAPSPRCGHTMAFDAASGVAVLFGGIAPDDRPLGDTWLFDGAAWKRVRGAGPPARRYAAFAYDPGLRGCLLHGGAKDDKGRRTFRDAWLFRDNTWTPLGQAFDTDPRDDHGLGYHRAAGRLVMLEGVGGARGLLARAESGWQPLDLHPMHPRHQCSPLAWDETLGGILLHGGEAHHGGPQFDDTLLLRVAASP